MRRLTKEQKVYVSILALAVMCLIADQLFFGPEDVTAQTETMNEYLIRPSERDTMNLTETITNSSATQSTFAHRIAARLEELGVKQAMHSDRVPDAFLPAWIPNHSQQALIENAAETLTEGQLAAQWFVEHHELTAVMGTGPRGYVIVDGKAYSIGDELDGFRLTTVMARAAIFERDGLLVELQLEHEPLSGVGVPRK